MNQFPSSAGDITRFCCRCGKWMIALALVLAPALPAQVVNTVPAKPAVVPSQPQPELEQGAMNALKTMSEQLRAANSFSFDARIMGEEPFLSAAWEAMAPMLRTPAATAAPSRVLSDTVLDVT